LLGFEWDGDCAMFAADDLLGRVVMAMAVEPTEARCARTREQEQAEW